MCLKNSGVDLVNLFSYFRRFAIADRLSLFAELVFRVLEHRTMLKRKEKTDAVGSLSLVPYESCGKRTDEWMKKFSLF
jgi:hypothetical protein